MYCPKCGAELPDDSTFCVKCGTKLENLENKQVIKRHLFRKLVRNPISNIALIIICIILTVVGFKTGRDNYPDIDNREKIVNLTQQLIDLTDSDPYVLGSSEKYKEELNKDKADYTKTLILTYGGYTLSILGAIGTCVLGYNLCIIYKGKKDKDVL